MTSFGSTKPALIGFLVAIAQGAAAIAQQAVPTAPAAPDTPPVTAPAANAGAMVFVLASEVPASTCGSTCRRWIVAQGRIMPDTAQAFEAFIATRQLEGLAIHFHSPGGHVRSALQIGERIRRLGLATRVSRSLALGGMAPDGSQPFRVADREGVCASACLFAFMGGTERAVPDGARILVHQIWPGSAREDAASVTGPTKTYTAREMAQIQETNARFAAYLVRMGADIGVYEAINSVPPWVAMRPLSRDELTKFRVAVVAAPATAVPPPPAEPGSAGAPPATVPGPAGAPPAAANPRGREPRFAVIMRKINNAPVQPMLIVTVPTRTQDQRRARYVITISCASRPGFLAASVREFLQSGHEPGERMVEALILARDRGVTLFPEAGGKGDETIASGLAMNALVEGLAWDPTALLRVQITSSKNRLTRFPIAGPGEPEAVRNALAACSTAK